MRKLDRRAATPACLASYQYGVHNWDKLTYQDKEEIRDCLEHIQGRRCAYCEGSLDNLDQHIEHFRPKSKFPHLTFAWENLYWSCYQPDSCGCYKDHGAGEYDINNLIDPCLDDPDEFFRFHTDGTISIRPELQPSDQLKAKETLRVFNLDPEWGRLRRMREAILSGYVYLVAECQGFSKEELHEILKEELFEAEKLPFSTAIRHVLTEP